MYSVSTSGRIPARVSGTGRMLSAAIKVSVQAEYWDRRQPNNVSVNPPQSVPAEDERLTFVDDAVTTEYLLRLLVYENGVRNENIDEEPRSVAPPVPYGRK